MELPSMLSTKVASNTRPKIEKHLVFVLDKSSPEEHFSQPLQTNIRPFKNAVTLLCNYNGMLNVKDKNINFYFTTSNHDNDISVIEILSVAFGSDPLNAEINWNIVKEGYFIKQVSISK